MKFKTFRSLVVAAALVAGGALTALAVTRCGEAGEQAAAEPQGPGTVRDVAGGPARPAGASQPGQPAAAAQPGGDGASPAGMTPLRDLDRTILARVAENIGSDKVKDALRGNAAKVNLYRDAGKARVNRLKIDLDRDDRDDEKWTFEDDGRVKRQVSPDDDERYTVEYRLDGEAWRLKR